MKQLLLLPALLFVLSSNAQEKKEPEAPKTKMEVFSSKTGSIIKFTDVSLPPLKSLYDSSETKIRKINSGPTTGFFFQIVKAGKFGSDVASIEYNDLTEMIKALTALKAEAVKDATSIDYVENKFITVDGFQLGYYVSKSKTRWFTKLDKYGSDNTIYFDSVDVIESAFADAKAKIDELKK